MTHEHKTVCLDMKFQSVGLLDADNTRFPNLALMKISAHLKGQGIPVEWYAEGAQSTVLASKVFTFTKMPEIPDEIFVGGSAGHPYSLPPDCEHITPDYELYGLDYSLGFLTRGCNNKCPWCIVPQAEGRLRAHADIHEFLQHDKVVLLDNDILGSPHGISQIEKMAELGVQVDFNQGLSARRIDNSMAKLLSRLRWLKPLRLACDEPRQMPHVQKAIAHLRWNNVTPTRYFCYALIRDVDEAEERIKFLKGLHLDPFAQPYRDREGTEPTLRQRRFARWVNHKAHFRSQTWKEYELSCGEGITRPSRRK